ncbi:hypothetical protein BUALT_Bualt10G0044400 [Buddleja alternifolia]|uniref:S1 motif domain-containing protein n=1 Tax=Buddleja alternifolia TaxID=168488 RepID=A0AAV6X2M1_9LAMI|nr:hypothetical protein BUALT_Bualt10G0044400 [Buddleja alternifolia]
MDSLTLSATTTVKSSSAIQLFSNSFFGSKKSSILNFPYRKPRKHLVFASKDDSKLDEWEQMELKFGRMIGEDPKITLTKIMGRKINPDLSYLEIEKLLHKKKGRAFYEDIEEVPLDLSDEKKQTKSVQGLNLVRPVPKKGFKEIPFDVSDENKSIKSVQGLNLVRPVPKKGTKFEVTNKPVKGDDKISIQPTIKATKESKSSVPDVILRKPGLFNEDDEKSSKFGMKPNLSLKMGKEQQRERFTDFTLLKRPEPMTVSPDIDKQNGQSGDKNLKYDSESVGRSEDAMLLQKPEPMNLNINKGGEQELSATELQADMRSDGNTFASDEPSGGIPAMSMDTALIGKPRRLDRSDKATDHRIREDVIPMNTESLGNPSELENFLTSPIKEREEDDWTRAEKLVKIGDREEVELISASTRGFVASFGSLIGFLPYRNLAARWKFLAFESWLRRKGLDPSTYRQNLGIIGKYEATSMTDTSESALDSEIDSKIDGAITSDMKLEDLLMIYDQEKLKFLSSFVGQRIRVGVVLADRSSRRLIFSIKPKEKEELVEKKRSLMAQLSVGDVVKCCIKKITYFGIFVEVEGVPALIHQTEVSWDATLDPASYFKVGQIVEAKVHQLDFSLERIFLSLKEIAPDPLIEALEAVVGDNISLDGRLEAAQADTEWADVESLIKELQQFDGIQSVSKGRYFLSPGLAPTFQVYMASMFENQYKLLARAGNRVQEVIVQTSLGKEELKTAIMTCTNRVE